jgi:cell division transport system permease protein
VTGKSLTAQSQANAAARIVPAALTQLARRAVPPPVDRVLPPGRGLAVGLAVIAALLTLAAIGLAALALAGGRLADEARGAVEDGATLSILADEAEVEAQARTALDILRTTKGVLGVRVIEPGEQRALLAPWLGTEVPIDGLTLPLMIAVSTDREALDADALRIRLAEAAPAAVFDDHDAWRTPLVAWGRGIAGVATAGVAVAAAVLAAAAGLATAASVAAARSAISVFRLVGGRDRALAAALARRAGRAAVLGAGAGAVSGLAVLGTATGTSKAVPLAPSLGVPEIAAALVITAGAAALAASAAALTAGHLLAREP